MVKRNDVRLCFDRLGFDSLRERGPGQHLRFMVTAIHYKHNVRVLVSAKSRFSQKSCPSGKSFNRRHVKVEIMDGGSRAIPGVQPEVIVTRLSEVESILERAAKGDFCLRKVS